MAIAGPGLGNHNDWYSTSQKRVVNGPQQGPGLGIYGDVYNPSSGRVHQSSGGGGGGGGGSVDPNSVPSVSEGEINSIYQPQMDYLNQVESALRGDLPNTINEANTNYKTSMGLLTNSRDQNLNEVANQETQGIRQRDDTKATSRRIFNEQRQGANARFGGSSSAGEAANELLGVEQMRQFGQTDRSFGEFQQKIAQYKTKIQNDFQTGVLQLEQNKQAAINQANRDFQNKLLEISNNRAQVSSAKAQARVSALMDLRNKVFSIQQQNAEMKQALATQSQADLSSLDSYYNSAGSASTGARDSFSGFSASAQQTPNALAMSGPAQGAANPYVGQTTGRRREDENRYAYA